MHRALLLASTLVLSACTTARPSGSRASLPLFHPAPLDAEAARRAAAKYARAQALLATASGQAALGEAATLFQEACDEGDADACAFVDAHITRPIAGCRIAFSRADVAPVFRTGTMVTTQVRCTVAPEGAPEDCEVVLDDPYGLSPAILRQAQACHWTPATLQGQPFVGETRITVTTYGTTGPVERIAEARQRVQRFPSSASSWRHLALLLEKVDPVGQEFRSALQRAVSAFPEDERLQAALARALLAQGRPQEALPHARSAVTKAPWDSETLETYATVSALLHRCPDAVLAQRQAHARASDDMPYLERARLEQRVAEFEKLCSSVSPE